MRKQAKRFGGAEILTGAATRRHRRNNKVSGATWVFFVLFSQLSIINRSIRLDSQSIH